MKKSFTILLYFLVILFLILWPNYIKKHEETQLNSDKLSEQSFRGVITFWDFPHFSEKDSGGFKFIKNKIENFQNKYPGVIIEFEGISEKEGYKKLLEAKEKGILPDIFPLKQEFFLEIIDELNSLNKYLNEKNIKEYKKNVLESFSYKGNIYGLPLGMYTNVIFVNKDKLNEKEITLPQGQEWNIEEFINIMSKLTYSQEKNYYYGIGFPIKEDTYGIWGFLLLDGAKPFDNNRFSFYGPQAVSGINILLDLFNKYKVVNPASLEGDMDYLWNDFIINRNTASLIIESYKIAKLKNLQSHDKLFNFIVLPYPHGESGVPLTLSPKFYGYGIKKTEDKKKLEMEYKFIKFITDNQNEVLNIGLIPIKENISIEDENFKAIEKAVEYTNKIPYYSFLRNINNKIVNEIKKGVKENETGFDIINNIKDDIDQQIK
ncbi:MAG: ABC transporter substrate-binding protein [Thermoanaerobacteraceae bacterium]